jgi:hypothetical protein
MLQTAPASPEEREGPEVDAVQAFPDGVGVNLDRESGSGSRRRTALRQRRLDDAELYFIVGNKWLDDAAGWWVQMDQELPVEEKTWTRLKSALMRRYRERPDQAMAEWRVYQRML